MNEQITKLEAEIEALFNLTLRAYARYIFLRPMLVDQSLHDRISQQAKANGFERLRSWLYWATWQATMVRIPSGVVKTRLRPPVQLGLSLPCARQRRKRPGFEDFKRFVRLLRLRDFSSQNEKGSEIMTTNRY